MTNSKSTIGASIERLNTKSKVRVATFLSCFCPFFQSIKKHFNPFSILDLYSIKGHITHNRNGDSTRDFLFNRFPLISNYLPCFNYCDF